jgi:hypothetical protein
MEYLPYDYLRVLRIALVMMMAQRSAERALMLQRVWL